MGGESNEDIFIHKTSVCAMTCTCHMYHEHYCIRNTNHLNGNIQQDCMLHAVVCRELDISFHRILSYYNA